MADNNDDRVFAFNGQLYPSYQEMINAKRQRNADILAKSGMFEAKAAVDAAAATATRLRRPTKASDRGLKRAAAAASHKQKYQQQYHSTGERRKSSRLAGDTAPKIYIDTESGGIVTIAGEDEAGSVESGRLGSQYETKEEIKCYNGRVNDGSKLTIATAVELTGPKWTNKDGIVERTEDFMSRVVPEIIDDMPIMVSHGKKKSRDGSSPTSVAIYDEQPSMTNKKKSSSSSSTKDGNELLLSRINNLVLEDVSTKVCPDRIYSITCHPSPNTLIVCAGDKQGNLGIWNVDQYSGSMTTTNGDDDANDNNGVHLFKPHSSVISTLIWNTSGTSLLSSSYDGSVRLFDIESQVFEEVFATYDNDTMYKDKIGYGTDQGYNSWIQSMELDHRVESGKCFYLSTSEGGVMHIDLRAAAAATTTTNKGGKLTFNTVLSERKINTISLHPDGNIMATAGLTGIVQLWDVRKMEVKKDKAKPVAWHDAGRSINSAYFSPSGRRLLTTTQSNKLEIFDDAHLLATTKGVLMTPKTSIRHDNQTGRWLSTLLARWHPSIMVGGEQEMFIVGSMQKPRCIEIYIRMVRY
jgi:WD40 repeat protein